MTNTTPIPTFEHVPFDDPRIDALLAALNETHANGGALLAQFAVRLDENHTWPYRPTRSGQGQPDFTALFHSPALAAALPQLQIDPARAAAVNWQWTGPYVLDGELHQALMQGGAYTRFTGPPKEAKRLAEVFCDALFGDRYRDVDVYSVADVYSADARWSPWFHQVAWDASWLIFDRPRRRLWLLCLTDTD